MSAKIIANPALLNYFVVLMKLVFSFLSAKIIA